MKKNVLLFSLMIICCLSYGQDANETVTDIEGNVYRTVKIGNQIWMAEDLKVTKYNVGTPIFNITEEKGWEGTDEGAYCWYYNDINIKSVYGALYNWKAVNSGRLAPKGWHVPTDTEWQTLIDFLGGKKVAGVKLKEAGTSHWKSPYAGDNSSCFNALPSGNRDEYGHFYGLGVMNRWWTSTSKNFLYIKSCYVGEKSTAIDTWHISSGCSVRCIKD